MIDLVNINENEYLVEPRTRQLSNLGIILGMTVLPVYHECEWMQSNEVFNNAVREELEKEGLLKWTC